MQLSYRSPIWFYQKPVDFRKQIDGLVILIADDINRKPTSGELFVFRNRLGDKIKLLWYDGDGFWLCYKRLESGCFTFPKEKIGALELSHHEMGWLLSGLDFTRQKQQKKVSADYFF